MRSKGALLVKPFVELFVKGIRVCVSWWEQFNPGFLIEVVTHQKGVVFFFHECGRHVGGVPRSSLKEGKHYMMMR